MSVNASLAQMSDAQLKKLFAGLPVRVRYGDAHQIPVLPIQYKKLMKANMAGKGMVLQVPKGIGIINQQGMGLPANPPISIMPVPVHTMPPRKGMGKPVLVHKTIKGSGMKKLKDAGNQFSRGEPFKLKDGTAPMSAEAIQSGRPFGGKIGRFNKATKWYQGVSRTFLPLNKNLSPVKQAGTARAVDYIENYNNPLNQVNEGLDMFQSEAPQTINALNFLKKPKPIKPPIAPVAPVYSGEPVYAEEIKETPQTRANYYPYNSPQYANSLFPVPPSYVPSYAMPPSYASSYPSPYASQEQLRYEPVQYYYGAGIKSDMKKVSNAFTPKKGGAITNSQMAKMSGVRAMRKSMAGNGLKSEMKKVSDAFTPPKKGGAVKGSPEMKIKMAQLRSMRKVKNSGGALYPAGYEG